LHRGGGMIEKSGEGEEKERGWGKMVPGTSKGGYRPGGNDEKSNIRIIWGKGKD